MLIRLLQGTLFKKDVKEAAKMIITNGTDKYILDSVEEDGKNVFYADADTTKDWHPR